MADGSLSHLAQSHDIFSQNLKELHIRVGYLDAYLQTLLVEGLSNYPTTMGVKSYRKVKEAFAELWGLTQDVKRLLPRPPA